MGGNWIAHRLPKPEECDSHGEVLVSTDQEEVEIAEWTGSEFILKDPRWCESVAVVAWQKKPTPYRGLEDEDKLDKLAQSWNKL